MIQSLQADVLTQMATLMLLHAGVRNPIEVAHALLLSHSKGLLPLRRIPPLSVSWCSF